MVHQEETSSRYQVNAVGVSPGASSATFLASPAWVGVVFHRGRQDRAKDDEGQARGDARWTGTNATSRFRNTLFWSCSFLFLLSLSFLFRSLRGKKRYSSPSANIEC